jgi:hypothetical protein
VVAQEQEMGSSQSGQLLIQAGFPYYPAGDRAEKNPRPAGVDGGHCLWQLMGDGTPWRTANGKAGHPPLWAALPKLFMSLGVSSTQNEA